MSPKKLTPKDKQEILDLYRNTPETTSTLAERFGVSSSTVSRFLKTSLSEDEYELLIQQKRLARVSKADSQLSLSLGEAAEASMDLPVEVEVSSPTPKIIEVVKSSTPDIKADTQEEPIIQVKTRKRRSTAKAEVPTESVTESSITPINEPESIVSSKPILKADLPVVSETVAIAEAETTTLPEPPSLQPIALSNADLGELVAELSKLPKLKDLEDLDDDLEDEDEDEEEDEDWEEDEDGTEDFIPSLNDSDNLKVLPLSAAVFPRTCYLVIDRTAELIVRPLKEFAHLGKIPPEEVQQKTLPIFDNHRVARRFSNRTQRVIKVPDSNILRKTSSYLKAKGITRIFLDGQVYSLATH
ncbi:MAG: helix-turn-helix domain-containing protein [Snowella sp.]|nr:helix-turn-helix domain-containing protein [Snowella sp.]